MSAADPVAPVNTSAAAPGVPISSDQTPLETISNDPPNAEAAAPASPSPAPAAYTQPQCAVNVETASEETPGEVALGMSRGDRLFAGTLGIVIVILLLVHWARLSGWGARNVEIARQSPQTVHFHLDVNSANWVELSQLDGLGEALARRIVDEREQKGPFQSVDDLRRVKGIGPKTLDKLRPWIRAEPPKSDLETEPKLER